MAMGEHRLKYQYCTCISWLWSEGRNGLPHLVTTGGFAEAPLVVALHVFSSGEDLSYPDVIWVVFKFA